jgi:hypothetical protein
MASEVLALREKAIHPDYNVVPRTSQVFKFIVEAFAHYTRCWG